MKTTGSFKSLIASAVFLVGASVSIPAVADNHMAGEKATMTIVESASQAESLSTRVAALKAAGLVETLSGVGPFTVFAPNNAAFAKLPEGTVEALLKPENKDKLTEILTYHVVPAKATAAVAIKMVNDEGGEHATETVQGGMLTLSLEGDKLMVADGQGNEATVIQADMMQSNGVVHVIDTVLMPGM